MPRIRDEFLDCVIYVYLSRRAAEKSERAGGSGFLVSVKRDAHTGWMYAVTNDHVIQGIKKTGGTPAIRLNTALGDTEVLEVGFDAWISHPKDDVAVCQIVPSDPSRFKFAAIPTDMFVTEERIEETRIGPGDDVFLIGRFINHEGKQRNLPSVRTGVISMMPGEKIRDSYGEREGYLAEVKSIGGYSGSAEVKSIGGYSGSPIVVSIPASRVPSVSALQAVGGPVPTAEFLLGVDCGHFLREEQVVWKNGGKETDYVVQSNTGMAIVVPAWKILDILNGSLLKDRREKDEEEARREGEGSVVLDKKS